MSLSTLALAGTTDPSTACPPSAYHAPTTATDVELMAYGNCSVYVASTVGRSDITAGTFEAWNPSHGWSKTPEQGYPTFAGHCVYASPGAMSLHSSQLQANEPWEGGLVWRYVANVCPSLLVLGGCFPEECDRDMAPPEGSVRYQEIAKCEAMSWRAGTSVHIVTDPDSNRYILATTATVAAAAGGGTLATPAPALPTGWTRRVDTLTQNLTVTPTPAASATGEHIEDGARLRFGSFACGHALLRDSGGNVYYRYQTTTGNANLLSRMNLVYAGNTPEELMNDKQSYMLIISTLVLLFCFCGVFCGIRHCASNELWCFAKGEGSRPPSRLASWSKGGASEATPLAAPMLPGQEVAAPAKE